MNINTKLNELESQVTDLRAKFIRLRKITPVRNKDTHSAIVAQLLEMRNMIENIRIQRAYIKLIWNM